MQPRDVHPVILAGGLGTRLRHVLPDLPKPMAPVCDRPFVEWVVRYLAGFGFPEVTLATGHMAEVIERHFAAAPVAGVSVRCVAEPRPLGTAGAFRRAARASRRSPAAWLVLNGDSLVLDDFGALLGELEGAEGGVVARAVEDAGRYGALAVEGGRLRAFAEKSAGGGPGLINAGVYLLRAALAERMPEGEPLSFEYDVFPQWLREGVPLAARATAAPFLDIGTEETLARAGDFLRQNRDRFP